MGEAKIVPVPGLKFRANGFEFTVKRIVDGQVYLMRRKLWARTVAYIEVSARAFARDSVGGKIVNPKKKERKA